MDRSGHAQQKTSVATPLYPLELLRRGGEGRGRLRRRRRRARDGAAKKEGFRVRELVSTMEINARAYTERRIYLQLIYILTVNIKIVDFGEMWKYLTEISKFLL